MKKILVVVLALALVFAMTGMGLAKPMKIRSLTPISGGGINESSVTQKARIVNNAYAESGLAAAVGNVGVTIIKDNDSSASSCSGCATNNANISVSNTGIAGAASGDANATNSGTNSISQSSTVTQSNTSSSTLCGGADGLVVH